MKKILTILLVALIGLTGCKSAESGLSIDNTSSQPNTKMGVRMDKNEDEEKIVTQSTSANSSEEVSFVDKANELIEIKDFKYVADKPDIINITTIKLKPSQNSINFYHTFNYNDKTNLVATNVKIVDGAGNEGSNYGYGDLRSSGDNLDITQKHFTVWYEFANDPEVGILKVEITLP